MPTVPLLAETPASQHPLESPRAGDAASGGLYAAAFEELPLSAAIVDASGVIIAVNRAWRQFAGDNGGDVNGHLGTNYLDVCRRSGDADSVRLAAQITDLIDGTRDDLEVEYPCHSPQRRRWFVMRAGRIHGDGRPYLLVCHADITDRRLAEEEAHRRAAEDALTGLLNRRSFLERLRMAIERTARRDSQLAVLFLDLNGFTAVNDGFGHAVGDLALCRIAEQLQRLLRRVDSLARMGGDEFAMFLDNAGADDAVRVADRIRHVLAEGVDVDDEHLEIGASIGASFYPRHGTDADDLLRAADLAMYQAKREGRHLILAADCPGTSD